MKFYLTDNRFMIWVLGLQSVASTTSGVTQFTTPVDHGLAVGNQFRILNSNDVSLGDLSLIHISEPTRPY